MAIEENSLMQRLNKLNEIKEDLDNQSEILSMSMNEEIALMKENISQKYDVLKANVQTKIDDNYNQIDDLVESIARASFFCRSFSKVLAELMSTFEGRKYTDQVAEYTYFDANAPLASSSKKVFVIVLEDVMQQSYSDEGDNSLPSLIENGQMIILEMAWIISCGSLSFYEANLDNHSLVEKVDLKKFDYVKEFIDMVIDWKIQNKVSEIPLAKIKELEVEYLRSKKSTIKLNYNMRTNEDRKKLEQRKKERKDNLEKMLSLNSN